MKRNDRNFSKIVSGLSVEVYDGNFDKALRIFNKKVQDSGLLKECRERMHHETKSAIKQKQHKMAKKRWAKKVESSMSPKVLRKF